jgi:hypothetical protein
MSGDRGAKTGGGLLLGFAILLLVTGAIAAVVAFPVLSGGEGRSDRAAGVGPDQDTPLLDLVSDPDSKTYLNTLDATFPSAANQLRGQLIEARRRDAPEAEVSLMLLKAGYEPLIGSLDRLSKADIRYFNRVLSLTEDRIETLSQSGARYCLGSDLVEYASLAEQQLYRTVFDHIEPGDPLYSYLLEVNGLLFDAVRDARSDPNIYARPSQSDMGALQTLGVSVLTDPDITLLLTTEGKSRSEMDAVLETVDFCELGLRMIGRVDGLPSQTKERIWYEGLRMLRINGIRRLVWMMQTY